jgi:tape measure domain-containing protein
VLTVYAKHIMSGTPLAELFARVGFQIDDADLKKFEMRLQSVKGKLQALKQAGKIRLEVDSSNSLRNVNQELMIMRENLRRIKQASVINPIRQPRVRSSAGAQNASIGANIAGAIGSSITPYLGVGAAYYGLKSVIDAGITMQGVHAQMLMVAGSTKEAGKQMQWLKDTTMELGVDFKSSAYDYAQFVGAAVGGGMKVAEAQRTMKSAMELGATLHMTPEAMHGQLYALQQIASLGRLQMQDMRQFVNWVPGGINLMVKASGAKNQAEFLKMLKAGKVMSNDLLPKLATGMEEAAKKGGGLEFAVHGMNAELNRFSNFMLEFKAGMSESGVGDGLAKALAPINAALKQFTEYAGGSAGKALGLLMRIIGSFIAVVITAISGLTDLISLMWEFKWITLGLTAALIPLGIFFGSTLAVGAAEAVAALAPLIVGFGLLFLVLDDLAAYAQGRGSLFGDALEALSAFAESIFATIKETVDSIIAGIDRIKAKLSLFSGGKETATAWDKLGTGKMSAEDAAYAAYESQKAGKPSYEPSKGTQIDKVYLYPKTNDAKAWADEFTNALVRTSMDFTKGG